MQILIKYTVQIKKYILLIALCLCAIANAGAQHKKSSHKKASHQSTTRKKTTSHHESSSHSKKTKHSDSRGKKSKHGKSKESSHSKRHGRHTRYEPANDEQDEEVAVVKTEPVNDESPLRQAFLHPSDEAKPWVFWYWIQGNVSREGITADLEAMKEAGIGGAYLMSIKGPVTPPLMNPPVVQLTPQWWQMVHFAMTEAQRIGVKLAMHDCDGFALAGGPWIKPEMSMQKLTWSKTIITGGRRYNDTLARPKTNEGYYKDVAVFAYPLNSGDTLSTETVIPRITSSKPGAEVQFLATKGNKKSFSSDTTCWIQYAFNQPFTCRSVTIRTNGNNYEAQRLRILVSDDGQSFRPAAQLEPARSGWQDGDAPNTYSINPVTAKYFRFVYDKAGSEPGAEDLESAKWKPNLRIQGIDLSGAVRINQFEGKNGEIWRVAKRTTASEVPDNLCIPKEKLINITTYLDASGRLNWNVPAGKWVIIRMGHTSTGHMNETGGGGIGLECDKFNPEVVKFQFDHWFGEAVRQAGPDLAAQVLKIFHVDSWECGSQNWSPVFQAEFSKRRGYDLLPYLPVMAGIPIQSAEVSEKVLYDVRRTIAELLVDNFYVTMARLAHEKGTVFSAESTAPTMVGDGMLHYREADLPTGEFWLNSPTHDKPSDMLDAISGGHIYGKNIIQAEAFTTVRMAWDEYPGMLKPLGDRNMALGVNRFVLHVFSHNPWLDRKPGMTLDGVGLYFQRDQTWWKQGFAWIQYLQRCQAMLQMGKPVVDVAVFTGEEVPRRAVLPDRLVSVLPGIFGADVVKNEAKRLANEGQPLHSIPDGVTSSANMAEPQKWVDPLRGYAYDSFNRDALLRLATVRDGRITLPGGASYGLLVLPGSTKMDPSGGGLMSPEVSDRIKQLVNEGANILINEDPKAAPGLVSPMLKVGGLMTVQGKGRILKGPYQAETFDNIGLQRDVIATDSTGAHALDVAWTHRTDPEFDIYFISNQQNKQRAVDLSFRIANKIPEMWDPVTGETYQCSEYTNENGRTNLTLRLEPNGSFFIVFRKPSQVTSRKGRNWSDFKSIRSVDGIWQVNFDTKNGGPDAPVLFTTLTDWSKNDIPSIKYYSGTADYMQIVKWNSNLVAHRQIWLDLGNVANTASVTINGIFCGTAWTPPYRVDITKALHTGYNKVHVEVSNTWANRLIGDHALPENKRVTWTTAPFRLEGKPLLPAGLLGPVKIVEIDRTKRY
ncbi:glycosyl hydrolase [Mucilaginibacter paludis]|uniref:Glycoside hydrolase family 2 sugar binding n=1 Tax=Mucilaginibacter paludis DSM 18603 TaxID=714943 RepID=H1YEN0_9SPHI|nr:glycosyl hydrolase [Mucilaginibacter paludis]EHQ30790.1 glycoside hydrolase family 2 sugar binding [Mucilaginibacter paludis DSM 18603]